MSFCKSLVMTLLLCSSSVMADDAADLKAKLASVKLFSAHFEQSVFDIEGKKLQQSSCTGKILINMYVFVPVNFCNYFILKQVRHLFLWN